MSSISYKKIHLRTLGILTVLLLCLLVYIRMLIPVKQQETKSLEQLYCEEGQHIVGKALHIERNKNMPNYNESVVYLIQGPADQIQTWKDRVKSFGGSGYLIYHSYDKSCHDCLYKKNTTFASGRNLLLRAALAHRNVKSFKYFSFIDFDLTMLCNMGRRCMYGDYCWRLWHHMLLQPGTQFARVVPKTWFDNIEPTNMQSCVDPAIMSLHKSAVHLTMPLPTYLEYKGWWYNSNVMCSIINKCAPLTILSDSRWRVVNPVHSPYPSTSGPAENIVRQILEHDFSKLGPWLNEKAIYQHTLVGHGVKRTWKIEKYCDEFLQQRFKKWVTHNT